MMKIYVLVQDYRYYDESGQTPILASPNTEYVAGIKERLSGIKTVAKMKAVFPNGPSTKSELANTTFEIVEVPSELVLGEYKPPRKKVTLSEKYPNEKSLTPAMKDLLARMRNGLPVYLYAGPLGGWWIPGNSRSVTYQMRVLRMLKLVREAPQEKQHDPLSKLWEAAS